MENQPDTRTPKSSVPIFPIIIVLVLAALICSATLIPAYDCEACNRTGWNQGLRGSEDAGKPLEKCFICLGTLRISFWSAWLGAHAEFMRPHR